MCAEGFSLPFAEARGGRSPSLSDLPCFEYEASTAPEVGHECVEEGSTVTRVPPSL